MTSFYTSQGGTEWNTTTLPVVTNVPFKAGCGDDDPSTAAVSGNSFVLCDELDGVACVTFVVSATDINVTTLGTGTICGAVAGDDAITAMAAAPQRLGGVGVVR